MRGPLPPARLLMMTAIFFSLLKQIGYSQSPTNDRFTQRFSVIKKENGLPSITAGMPKTVTPPMLIEKTNVELQNVEKTN